MDQIEKLAFNKWHMHFVPSAADCKTSRKDWLSASRKALLLTLKTVAEKLGMAVQSYWELEQRERDGMVTIRDLREGADALGCELVYFLQPKGRDGFAFLIWQKLKERAMQNPKVVEAQKYQPTVAATAIAAEAIRLFKNQDFRKEMGWSRLKTTRNNHKYKRTKPIKNWAMPEPRPSRRNRGR